MHEDDYRALIVLVRRELRASGAAEIASDQHYTYFDEVADETRQLPPKEHLTEMLKAFGRLLAIQDRRTYDVAMSRIRSDVRDAPARAVVVPLNGSAESEDVDLGRAPNLQTLRSELRVLIGQLAETREPPEPFREM